MMRRTTLRDFAHAVERRGPTASATARDKALGVVDARRPPRAPYPAPLPTPSDLSFRPRAQSRARLFAASSAALPTLARLIKSRVDPGDRGLQLPFRRYRPPARLQI